MHRRILQLLILVSAAVFVAACSIPTLESPACTESKNAVREFYSYHFGNEMKFSAQGLKQRAKFLTPEFAEAVGGSPENTDPFTTGTDDLPKAFRVGECKEISPEKTQISMLIFWRDETRTEQREIKIEAIDKNDSWLVNNISK